MLFRKEESAVEVINDINKDVVTLYRVVQHHLEEFIRYFKWMLISREEYNRLAQTPPDTLTDIQRSARFYYLQHAGFNGRVLKPSFRYSTTSRPKINLLRIEETLSEAHLRLSRVFIECLPYAEVIKRYDRPHTFFYIDPPYWGRENYYGLGYFSQEDFRMLADVLKGIQGRFILSLNDTPEVREIFGDFRLETIDTLYSCTTTENRQKATELLFLNW